MAPVADVPQTSDVSFSVESAGASVS